MYHVVWETGKVVSSLISHFVFLSGTVATVLCIPLLRRFDYISFATVVSIIVKLCIDKSYDKKTNIIPYSNCSLFSFARTTCYTN